MIGFIQGTIKASTHNAVLVYTGALGFEIVVANAHQYTEGATVQLYVYTHWTQEHGASLFGFTSSEEKVVFLALLDCSGIGPKTALAALEELTAAGVVQAIATNNHHMLSTVSGIGKKKAEQVVIQLHDKITKLAKSGSVSASATMTEMHQISDVLTSLHYSRTEIGTALEFLKKNNDGNTSFDYLLRKALTFLSKRV